jgi:hypothetical protein
VWLARLPWAFRSKLRCGCKGLRFASRVRVELVAS